MREITEEKLDFLKACAIIGESQASLSTHQKQQTIELLNDFVENRGYRYFYFGPIGPFENFCLDHLRTLQKNHEDILLINFRLGSEFGFNAEEAVFFQEVLRKENIQPLPHAVFDATVICDGDVYPGVKKTQLDRNREMIKRVITVLMYYNTRKISIPNNMQFDTRKFSPEKSGVAFAFEYAKMRPCNLINIAEK